MFPFATDKLIEEVDNDDEESDDDDDGSDDDDEKLSIWQTRIVVHGFVL